MKIATFHVKQFWPPEEPLYDISYFTPYGNQQHMLGKRAEEVPSCVAFLMENGSKVATSFFICEHAFGFPVVASGRHEAHL